jgi:hypothetical protein
MQNIQFDVVRVSRLGDQVAEHIGYARGDRSQRIVTERVDWPEA